MEALWNLFHGWGVHFYFIPSLIVLLILLIVLLVHSHNQKKRDEKFEDELEKIAEEQAAVLSAGAQG